MQGWTRGRETAVVRRQWTADELVKIRHAILIRIIGIGLDPMDVSAEEQARLGIRRLPSSLSQALDTLAADDVVTGWFSKDFLDCYFAMKRKEIDIVEGLSPEALCARYAAVY